MVRIKFVALAAVAAAALLAVPDTATARALSTCGPLQSCVLPGQPETGPERAIRLADRDAGRDRRRRDGIRRCCAKYRAGLPLRGQFCSIQIVVRAFETGQCTGGS